MLDDAWAEPSDVEHPANENRHAIRQNVAAKAARTLDFIDMRFSFHSKAEAASADGNTNHKFVPL